MATERRDEAAMTRLEEHLCFAVYQAGHAFNRAYRPILAKLGLTYPQYLAMLVLWDHDGLTVKAMGERLMLDSGTLTPLLKRLEGAGLVRRLRDPRDERQVRLFLTEAGETLRAKGRCVPEAIGCALGGSLAEADDLRRALERVRDALLAAAGEA